jgi:hypothetical protein
MSTLITAATVKSALRDARAADHQYDVSDSKIAGLQLRVRKETANWSVRARLGVKQRRFDLGRVCEGGGDDAGGICLRTARSWAFKVKELCAAGVGPLVHIAAWQSGMTVEKYERSVPVPEVASWLWEHAIDRFIAGIDGDTREVTRDDYRKKLTVPELVVFAGRQVNTLGRNELMMTLDQIPLQSMRDASHRVVRRMMNWLAEPSQQDLTNVREGLLNKTRTKKNERVEIGENDANFDPDDERSDAPPPIELGRALVIARAGIFPERVSLGLQLLLGTAQRRRTVLTASRWRFKAFPGVEGEHAWYIPPAFRKSGSKRGKTYHLVPVVGWCNDVLRRLDRLSDFVLKSGDINGWLFPMVRPDSASDDNENGHAEISILNRALEAMPGVDFAPHGVRYGFGTHGEGCLGFAKSEAKVVLDHMEGTDRDDVTGQFYSSDPAISRKRAMMQAWTTWLDEQAAAAIAADPLLFDREYLVEQIFINRYGEAALARRIAHRRKHGQPLWADLRGKGFSQAAE